MRRCRRRQTLAVLFAVLASVLALATARGRASATEPSRPLVVVARVHGLVDLGLAPFLDRALDEAERDHAAAVVLDIDTFGGRLDAAVAIRDRLLASRIRTVAYVHPRAISAGALIALAASTIATSGGATIGAATPVQVQAGVPSMPVDEKTVSYVRKEFRATAEQRGRPPELAEAMVDADVDVPELAPAGKLLTLTGDEALARGVADVRADDVPSLVRALGIEDAELRDVSPNWAERAVRVITSPLVSTILMTLGIVGLLVELQTPGFGVAGIVGIVCLGLFFGGHWIVRLAGFEELVLIGIGLVLAAVEIFVAPGFGVPGVLAILFLAAGFGLSLVGSGATVGAVVASLGRVAIAFAAAIVAIVLLLAFLPHAPLTRRLVLSAGGPAALSIADTSPSWVGAAGATVTPLRPAGTAQLGDERVDVVTEGEFVPAGEAIEVIKHEGNRVVVRRAHATGGRPPERSGES